jgi:hypothetical protein
MSFPLLITYYADALPPEPPESEKDAASNESKPEEKEPDGLTKDDGASATKN